MTQLCDIYQQMHEEGTVMIARYKPLPCEADAAVIDLGGQYGIFYDLSKLDTLAKEKSAAFHEWAHLHTGAMYRAGATASVIQRAEHRARIAQIRKMLPAEELRAAMEYGHTTVWELAEYFSVPEDDIRDAIEYYTCNCGIEF